MAKIFRKLRVNDKNLMDVQVQIEQAINPVIRLPLIDYHQIDGIAVGTAPVTFVHKLIRQPLGWYIVDNVADARVWRTDWNDNTMTLQASAATTISIIVF